jgi:D-3-phosphoglycerate dehydrogenase
VFRVLVSDGMGMLDGLAAAIEEEAAADVAVDWQVAQTADELVAAVAAAGADAVVTGAGTPVTRAVLRDTDVEVVVRAGVGVDNVDLDAAREYGVAVANAPDYCTREVGEHAVALLLAVARRLHVYDRQTRRGDWAWDEPPAPGRLGAATLGFVGFGSIAQSVADAAVALAGDAVAYDPYVDEATAADYGVALADFETVCERSDLLAVFAPLTEETNGLVDEAALGRLPDGAVVVNVGRGAVVDDGALAGALDDGPVSAAALDVLPTEPPVDSPLVGRDDVLVTPHAGWYSAEARRELVDSVAASVAAVADGETVPGRTRVV